MNPKLKYLDELSLSTRYYSVKVRVTTKNRDAQPVGKSRYQRLILKDENGNHMDATLYEDDIEMFKDIIQKNGEYEISNTFISRANPNFSTCCAYHQMTTSSWTLVKRLDFAASSSQTGATYRAIGSIPRNPYTNEEFDLIAVVLYVGPPKPITRGSSFPVNVSELAVTDDSTEGTLAVSLWNDLTNNEAVRLASEVNNYPIISFSDLHASTFHGFSLASSRSTLVLFDPVGERVEALTKWKKMNVVAVKERKSRAEETRTTNTSPVMSTIKEMLEKMPENIVYD